MKSQNCLEASRDIKELIRKGLFKLPFSANRIAHRLIASGWLKPEGVKRGRRYIRGEGIIERFIELSSNLVKFWLDMEVLDICRVYTSSDTLKLIADSIVDDASQ